MKDYWDLDDKIGQKYILSEASNRKYFTLNVGLSTILFFQHFKDRKGIKPTIATEILRVAGSFLMQSDAGNIDCQFPSGQYWSDI